MSDTVQADTSFEVLDTCEIKIKENDNHRGARGGQDGRMGADGGVGGWGNTGHEETRWTLYRRTHLLKFWTLAK